MATQAWACAGRRPASNEAYTQTFQKFFLKEYAENGYVLNMLSISSDALSVSLALPVSLSLSLSGGYPVGSEG